MQRAALKWWVAQAAEAERLRGGETMAALEGVTEDLANEQGASAASGHEEAAEGVAGAEEDQSLWDARCGPTDAESEGTEWDLFGPSDGEEPEEGQVEGRAERPQSPWVDGHNGRHGRAGHDWRHDRPYGGRYVW